MSQDEWDNLQPGMIVIQRRSRTPRLVLAVSCSQGKPKLIEMRKLRASQYACPNTLYDPYMWRTMLDVAHGKRGRVRKEFFYCECHGWSHVGRQPAWVDPAYVNAHPGTRAVASKSPVPKPDWSHPEFRHAR